MVFRRRMRRRSGPTSYPKTFKKVLNFAPAAHGAGTKVDFLIATGIDSISPGQTGVTDATVPTGSRIRFITIQYGSQNLGVLSLFMHTSIQNLVSGQAATVSPNLVGGNPQRNQVHHQELRSVGPNQNATFQYRFKVPKQLQRLREGSEWFFTIFGSNAYTDSCQVIYKIET